MNIPEMHIDPELLSAYLDDEVTANERQLIQTHLPTCAACQQTLESLRFTVAMVHALPPRPIPRPFYVTEEMVAPQAKAASGGWWEWLRRLAPYGATVAALLVVLVLTRPYMIGTGGTAAPAAAPQATNAEIAVAPANGAAESMPVEESAAPEGEMQTRQSDPTPAMDTAMAPPEEAVEAEDTTATTNSFSITAPIVGADDGTQEDADAVTGPVADTVPITETGTVESSESVVTPATINTMLIVTVIVVVVAVGLVVILARQRQ